ncbi:hypothetical protein [Microvirga ossetica]|uniref:hypothetical protein n=1 Tax=Microvirga ossetica TaxID=1882682 RepID=UPI00130000FD|nr:hypothetical protein [Microvirga ossetica]
MTLLAIEPDVPQEGESDRFFDPWRVPRSEGAKTLISKIIGNVKVYEEWQS